MMSTLGRPELIRRLGYHPAGPATAPIFELNRAAALVLADLWDQVLPPGREAACALTALQEALMWANAAVACNLDPNTAELPEAELGPWLETLLDRVAGPEMTRSGPGTPSPGPDRPEKRLFGTRMRPEAEAAVDALEQRRQVAELDADGVPEQTR
jgi:hypothetical protein